MSVRTSAGPPARPSARHPSLYLLSDHLDAALALGEDMLAEQLFLAGAEQPSALPQQPMVAQSMRRIHAVRAFLHTVHTLELTLTARLLQARARAEELKKMESRLKPLIALLLAGTVALVDAAAELGDPMAQDFERGDAASAFMRSRGLLARDAVGLEGMDRLAVSEDYLVAGRIHLGGLLDLVATFLDTLDRTYDLYQETAAA
jgi:hypothetical protein